jgi:hypothetical protein
MIKTHVVADLWQQQQQAQCVALNTGQQLRGDRVRLAKCAVPAALAAKRSLEQASIHAIHTLGKTGCNCSSARGRAACATHRV